MEKFMNKSLALLIGGLAVSSMAHAMAASYSSADMKARQQMVQSATEHGVVTSGARATAWQDAQNVMLSRQIAKPSLAERHADVIASAVYPQSGPSTAALQAKNTAVSLATTRQTQYLGTREAERQMEQEATP
jgi:hypothetical protein